ncbi:unnamed protein product [Arabidopsis halleri]
MKPLASSSLCFCKSDSSSNNDSPSPTASDFLYLFPLNA